VLDNAGSSVLAEILDCKNIDASSWYEIMHQAPDERIVPSRQGRTMSDFLYLLDEFLGEGYVNCWMSSEAANQPLQRLPKPYPSAERLWFSLTAKGRSVALDFLEQPN